MKQAPPVSKEISQISHPSVWQMPELGVGVRVELVRVMICLSESSIEHVEVSHFKVECKVINHHLELCKLTSQQNIRRKVGW